MTDLEAVTYIHTYIHPCIKAYIMNTPHIIIHSTIMLCVFYRCPWIYTVPAHFIDRISKWWTAKAYVLKFKVALSKCCRRRKSSFSVINNTHVRNMHTFALSCKCIVGCDS